MIVLLCTCAATCVAQSSRRHAAGSRRPRLPCSGTAQDSVQRYSSRQCAAVQLKTVVCSSCVAKQASSTSSFQRWAARTHHHGTNSLAEAWHGQCLRKQTVQTVKHRLMNECMCLRRLHLLQQYDHQLNALPPMQALPEAPHDASAAMDAASHPALAPAPRSRTRTAAAPKHKRSQDAAAAGTQPAAAGAADLLSTLATLQHHPGTAAHLFAPAVSAPAAAPAAATRSEGAAASNGGGNGNAAAGGALSPRPHVLSSIDRAMDHIRQGTSRRRAPTGAASARRATFAADAASPDYGHIASPTSAAPAGPAALAAPAATALSPLMHHSLSAGQRAAAPAGELSSDDVSSLQQGARGGAAAGSAGGSKLMRHAPSTLTPSRSQATTSAGSLATTRSGGSRRKGTTPSRASLQ
jgi:hypothetical protein